MKQENRIAGSSLIEVVVAITVLGLVTVPIMGSLVLAHRLNAKSEQLMADQLAVTMEVETLMSTGVDEATTGITSEGVKIIVGAATNQVHPVTVERGDVVVSTQIREKPSGGAADEKA